MLKRISLNLPTDLYDRLKALAKQHRRTITAELVLAIEEHLKREEVGQEQK